MEWKEETKDHVWANIVYDKILKQSDALRIAGKKVDGIIVMPGEVFSLWNLVGKTSKRKGYVEALTVSDSELGKGIGGGL